jgi:hypothetical protein
MYRQLKPFFAAHPELQWLRPLLVKSLAGTTTSPTALANRLWGLIDQACTKRGVPPPLVLQYIPTEIIPALGDIPAFNALAREAFAIQVRRARTSQRSAKKRADRPSKQPAVPKKQPGTPPRPPRRAGRAFPTLPSQRRLSALQAKRKRDGQN